jgi:hypothetical protein
MNLKARVERLENSLSLSVPENPPADPDCICYPASQCLSLFGDEIEAAEAVQCPLHGNRIPAITMVIYRAKWLKKPELSPLEWDGCDPQYQKGVLATRAYLEGDNAQPKKQA